MQQVLQRLLAIHVRALHLLERLPLPPGPFLLHLLQRLHLGDEDVEPLHLLELVLFDLLRDPL